MQKSLFQIALHIIISNDRTLQYFREKGYLEKIPVVIITGEANATVIERIKKGYNVAAILLKEQGYEVICKWLLL